MKLHLLTIVLDGMPFLPMQLATFNRLQCDWTWHLVEGPAANVNCTSWCKPQEARLSRDGSHEFIKSLMDHPRVHVRWSHLWRGGKVEMCNAGIEHINEPCLLMEVDVDELWTAEQIECILDLFETVPDRNCARFFCQYLVGPNIVTVGENCYGNNPAEWLRAWRFQPGMKFRKHEPPELAGINEPVGGWEHPFSREDTRGLGYVFSHWAYVFESQVAYKEKFYGYFGAVNQWKRLQSHRGPWPVKLKDFLPWVDDRAQADLLHKPGHNWKRNPGDGQP